MEFLKLVRFQYVQQRGSKSTLMTPKEQKRVDKVKITCCRISMDKNSINCGLTDGSIMQFTKQKYNLKKLTESKQYEIRRFNYFPNQHKGEIQCILCEKIFDQHFVITGSADRTIKIWDTQPKSKDIVQTLSSHNGTIICLGYSRKSDTLFSGSIDKSIRIWRQDEGRKFFMYPWYVCYQVINEFNLKKIQNPIYPTSLDLHDGQISNFNLYVGDSAGNLHIIKEIQLQQNEDQGRIKTAFEIDRTNYAYHRLNINAVIYVVKEHLVITCSYDQHIYGFQSLSDKLVLKYMNPRKNLFTCLSWYQHMLVAGDEEGFLYCIEVNSDKDIDEIKKYDKKINQLIPIPEYGELLVVTDDFVDVVKIIRGVKIVEGQNSHSDAIVGIFALEPYKITQKKIRDTLKIVTVSLDNTMRVWDPTNLTCLQILYNTQKSQICSLFYLQRANLFVTGHDNGSVKLWNIQLQTHITITQKNSPHSHKNNVCAFASYNYYRGNEDVTEYMFSTGYQGKINVWQIFIKQTSKQSSLMSSTICPQLKYSFFPNDQQQQNPDKIGFQLFCLQVYEIRKGQDPQALIVSAGTKGEVYFNKILTYETVNKIKLHKDTINCIIIDQNILFTGSYDHTIKMLSLENYQELNVLDLHNASVNRLEMLQETGHLISQSSDGEVIFWDYIQSVAVKKIKQKKQTILCSCYFDELQRLYVGSQEAKIVSYSLNDLYGSKETNKLEESISQESLNQMIKQNQQEMNLLLSGQR